jgi:hypothetical protein
MILTWKGKVYKIKRQMECAKYGDPPCRKCSIASVDFGFNVGLEGSPEDFSVAGVSRMALEIERSPSQTGMIR